MLLGAVLLGGGLIAGGLIAGSVPGAAAGSLGSAGRPAVIQHRVIGHTVAGRAIHAWRVGDPTSTKKVVVLAAMHGDEQAPRQILLDLRDGRPVTGVDLWLVPTVNRDGVVHDARKNAHGVDLNRNFPREWAELDGAIESGPGPASEPETRALMRFLRRVDPRFVVSFHQPLYGIDTYGAKKRWFARRLSRELRLPAKEFACGNACHGTLSQWFNHRFDGVAVTVEYGRHPSARRMGGRAPRQLLRALRASR
ncbi:MAG TPA: M14 family zinc carboxypeptidase [Nocardioidaceae bacterium]|nr:M14 family zinc carboxypeptidase [Nocardioidaceae bacterium]